MFLPSLDHWVFTYLELIFLSWLHLPISWVVDLVMLLHASQTHTLESTDAGLNTGIPLCTCIYPHLYCCWRHVMLLLTFQGRYPRVLSITGRYSRNHCAVCCWSYCLPSHIYQWQFLVRLPLTVFPCKTGWKTWISWTTIWFCFYSLFQDKWLCSRVGAQRDTGWNFGSIFWHTEDSWHWRSLTVYSAHVVQIWWMLVLSQYALLLIFTSGTGEPAWWDGIT